MHLEKLLGKDNGQWWKVLRPAVRRSSTGRRGRWRRFRAATVAATPATSGTARFQPYHRVQVAKSGNVVQVNTPSSSHRLYRLTRGQDTPMDIREKRSKNLEHTDKYEATYRFDT